MQPGRRMDVTTELTKADAATDTATFKCKGVNDAGESTVTAIFVLHGYALAGRGPTGAATDAKLVEHWKTRWALLTGGLRL
jgi:3-hydroxyacyl-[acyl-carrier-protein] dehydratase